MDVAKVNWASSQQQFLHAYFQNTYICMYEWTQTIENTENSL